MVVQNVAGGIVFRGDPGGNIAVFVKFGFIRPDEGTAFVIGGHQLLRKTHKTVEKQILRLRGHRRRGWFSGGGRFRGSAAGAP